MPGMVIQASVGSVPETMRGSMSMIETEASLIRLELEAKEGCESLSAESMLQADRLYLQLSRHVSDASAGVDEDLIKTAGNSTDPILTRFLAGRARGLDDAGD